MKRLIFTLLVVFCSSLSLKALNYEDARREAWFLTDKMAYELNLTSEHCDLAYQINLEYLLSIHRASDCGGVYWTFRNDDFRCVLFPWQYSMYITLDYFYYPIRWVRSSWYYPVWRRYRRGYYYFDRPVVYVSYRGGTWRHRSHRDYSPYRGRHFSHGVGLRDRYHGGKGHRPEYRPEHGRPSRPSRPGRDFDNQRTEQQCPSREHGNVRPDRRPDMNGRPSRNERPSLDRDRRDNGFSNGNSGHGNVRPSREFGKEGNRGSVSHSRSERSVSHDRSNSRERKVSHDRGGSHDNGGERGSRHFGR